MTENSLFEILGILIGFAGIMLVLSLLVTALTQSILYGLSIRARNLQAGLEELLATAQEEGSGAGLARARKDCEAKRIAEVRARAMVDSLRKTKAKTNDIDIAREEGNLAVATSAFEEAKEKLAAKKKLAAKEKLAAKKAKQNTDAKGKDNYDSEELAKKILESNSLMKQGKIRCLPKCMSPKASWILKDELEILLHDHKEISAESIEKVMSWFSRMERGLSQRFNTITRIVTIVCALLVACVFQVSAPDVLKKLSTDSQYRAQAEMAAANLLKKYEGKNLQGTGIINEDVSAEALEQLKKKHSDIQETLEKVSGSGRNKDDILYELSIVLKDNPRRETLMKEYESILDELHRKEYEKAVKRVEESVGDLALFDIVPFLGRSVAGRTISYLLGILMTVILISLGAPFWFSMLQKLVNLRDTLVPKENKKAGNQASETPND